MTYGYYDDAVPVDSIPRWIKTIEQLYKWRDGHRFINLYRMREIKRNKERAIKVDGLTRGIRKNENKRRGSQ